MTRISAGKLSAHAAVALTVTAFIALAGGKAMAKSSGFDVWVADALTKVLPDSKAPARAAKQARVEAVRNEYESAQIVVTAARKIEKLTVSIGAVAGPVGPKPGVKASFVGFVPVRKGTRETPDDHLLVKPPAEVPDPLLESESVSVEPAKNQPIWLTVHVPKDAEPGEYSCPVEVTGDGETVSVPLIVNVHAVTLPDERTLYVTNWFFADRIAVAHGVTQWSEPFWTVLGGYARFMAERRQNVILTPILQLIKRCDDGKGNMTFDFRDFDRWVEVFRKAGVIGTIEGGHLGYHTNSSGSDFEAIWMGVTPECAGTTNPVVTVTSEEYRRFLSQFLPALQKHLEEKGWIDIYVQHLCDEPVTWTAENYKKLASYVRQYAPKIKIIEASMCSDLAGAIDIWVVQPPHYLKDRKFFQERQKARDETWFYTCCGPNGKYMNRFVDYPLLDVRLLHWGNFKYGLTGYLHWGFNFWGKSPFMDIEPDFQAVPGGYLPPGDTHIIYPGKYGPLSSVRLEAMRDGIEDYELLKLLQKKSRKRAREICDSIVKSFSEYTLDPRAFRKARMRLLDALES